MEKLYILFCYLSPLLTRLLFGKETTELQQTKLPSDEEQTQAQRHKAVQNPCKSGLCAGPESEWSLFGINHPDDVTGIVGGLLRLRAVGHLGAVVPERLNREIQRVLWQAWVLTDWKRDSSVL